MRLSWACFWLLAVKALLATTGTYALQARKACRPHVRPKENIPADLIPVSLFVSAHKFPVPKASLMSSVYTIVETRPAA